MAKGLVDLSYLSDFCDGDRSRMATFIRMYLQTAPGTFVQLKEKLAEGDAAGLASVAHSLRPQVTHMGAQRLLDRLRALEELAKAEGAAACIGSVDEVMALSRHVNEDLQAHLDQGLIA